MPMNPEDNGGGAALPGVEHHRKTSRRLIRQARYELEKRGDRVRACDKASGAVAHGVKAAAEARYWRSDSHNYRRRIVNLLAAEYGQPELNLMQDAADQLHSNYYKDMMYEWEVGDRLGVADRHAGRLYRAAGAGAQSHLCADPGSGTGHRPPALDGGGNCGAVGGGLSAPAAGGWGFAGGWGSRRPADPSRPRGNPDSNMDKPDRPDFCIGLERY